MIKHFIEYLTPGFFVAEDYSKEIPERKLEYAPEHCSGFRFYDREIVDLDGELLQGKPKNYSPYYYKGTELTLDEVKKTMSNHHILIGNMESNKWNRVVKLSGGQIWPLRDGDIVI